MKMSCDLAMKLCPNFDEENYHWPEYLDLNEKYKSTQKKLEKYMNPSPKKKMRHMDFLFSDKQQANEKEKTNNNNANITNIEEVCIDKYKEDNTAASTLTVE